MEGPGESTRNYWRAVLGTGGRTVLPRWTGRPAAGAGGHDSVEATVPAGVTAALRSLTDPRTAVLAAHAVVLGALTGESSVVTGYVPAPDRGPLPCPLSTSAGSWRALLAETGRAESQLLRHADIDPGELAGLLEPGAEAPAFDSVLDPSGGQTPHAPEAPLWTEVVGDGDRLTLRLRYRSDVLDAGAAARIAGYHVTALSRMVTAPDTSPDTAALLSDAERHTQLHELAGRQRDLPDARVHELIEHRAHATPDAVAAVRGDVRWTYAELNARANRLARELLARGLCAEDVVAVVTERTLDWLAAVLAILKAGGAYLPIEPHFPAGRIATTLGRAGCGLVVTEPGSTTNLDDAVAGLPEVTVLSVADVSPTTDDTDPGIVVRPDQLAYIYFTSGSTGEPKGAMCEQAGMLNHVHAKIDDLEITADSVVAQTAPQCFDISLWQLLAPLVAGGRTLLVEQEAVLDVGAFLDRIVAGGVSVLQVVPSYLEVLLSHVERAPRELPSLRYVSVTGEAVKKELVQRFFADYPGIGLVNAYGLTETSDDTNHEVMHAAPAAERVPLGACVANVRAYVVDEDLALVPLGAPGEIVFSGVCVGRGYVGDPERTRQSFVDDPYRPGERLYRSGDFGRWTPEGKLEFFGRRDGQVKIRGIRVEIGEIENALLRVPGVRDGAIVVVDRAGKGRHLAAWYAAAAQLDVALLRDTLSASLPEFMVPAVWHWRETLPLTGNGKIDKRALRTLAAELDAMSTDATGFRPPDTPTERRLAAAWASVLGVPQEQIDRGDSFFDRGGTSLSAVQLAVALDRAVSLREIVRNPVLADLAGVLEDRLVAS